MRRLRCAGVRRFHEATWALPIFLRCAAFM
jgi:hypothetical protein